MLSDDSVNDLAIEKSDSNTATPPEIAKLFDQRLKLLQSILDEIRIEALNRKKLRNGALSEIDEELRKLSSLLLEVAPLGRVNYSGKYVDSLNARRMHLEKSISRLKELKRTHKVETWKDIVALKRELFKILPEYIQLQHLKDVLE